MVTYQRERPEQSAGPAHNKRTLRPRRITTVRLALDGRPLPRIEDAIRIGELVRVAAISAADRVAGPDGVPPEISGHAVDGELNHRHAFYLPEDADADGFIDHVLVHAPGGLSRAAVAALDAIGRRGLWTQDGSRWAVVFEGAWERPRDSRSCYARAAPTWVSVTPYLHPWYAKRGFNRAEQIARECVERGLPTLAGIQELHAIGVRGRERRALHFHRFRSKRGLRQPDSRGALVEITFVEAISGPLALGFGCHYGLGLFAPTDQMIRAAERLDGVSTA